MSLVRPPGAVRPGGPSFERLSLGGERVLARAPAAWEADDRPVGGGDLPGLRILLIEDNRGDAVLVRELLRDAGLDHEIVWADSLSAGLARFALEPFSIVLADLGLPDGAGLDTFRRIRAAVGTVPIVVLSGLDDEQVSAEAVREGAQDYLIKGRIDPSSLERALRYAIERSRAAERVLRSETLLSVAEEIAHLGSWELDVTSSRLRWSDELHRIYGLRQNEFDGSFDGYLARVHADDREAVRAAIARSIATGEPFGYDERIVRPDGTIRLLHSEGRVIVDAAGRTLRLTVACQDVTDRRRAEEALAANARQQAVVADLGRQALGGVDIETLKREIVRQVSEVLHVEACEITEFSVAPSAQTLPPPTAAAGNLGTGGGVSVLIPGKDHLYGTLGVRSRARRQFPRDDVNFLQSVANILAEAIERKRVEDELRAARDEALRSARLKSAFLANMSHEIRTPVNVMLGYNAILEDSAAGIEEPGRTMLFEGVRNAGMRLMSTIDGILDLSKIETRNFEIRPQEIALGPFLERRMAEIEPLARAKGLTVACTIGEPASRIRFDEYCLARALQNLLQNALKFTERGSIGATLDRDAEGCLRMTIVDTGIGVDASYLPRLFERFSQEEAGYGRRFEGSGLGLALSKEYLELNGATISAQSEKGRGTRLRIRFPRECELADESADAAVARSAARTVNRLPVRLRVLVVEDDPASQVYMDRILADRCDVRIASSAAQVHERLLEGPADVVLMDLSLGGQGDGLSITRELRADPRWSELPIIATTAHAFPEDRQRALDAGCSAYIAKPFRRAELFEVIEQVLRRSDESVH